MEKKRKSYGWKNTSGSFLASLGARWKDFAGFFLVFISLAAPLYLLIYLKADFRFAQESVAMQVAVISRLLGNPAVAEGYLVKSGNVILEVIEACVAWKDIFAFVALVLAVPNRSVRDKALGILAGSVAIYAGNLARLLTVLFVAVRNPPLAEVVHSVLWKFGMIALILLLWLAWLGLTKSQENVEKRTVPHPAKR